MRKLSILFFVLVAVLGCQDDRTSQNGQPSTMPSATGIVPTMAGQSAQAPAAVPVASFTVSPGTSGTDSTLFTFDGSGSTGTIIKYRWRFGDQTYDSGPIVTKKYTYGGKYTVKLIVVSDTKEKNNTTMEINIDGPPKPPGGGGGGGGVACTSPAPNRGFIYGTVVGVNGYDAITQLPAGSTCANSYYYCGDMRRADPEQFRGIIHGMKDLGGAKFAIFNDCPYRWPPAIGERDFLYWKSCAVNYCP